MIITETEGLLLRHFAMSDLAAMNQVCGDADVMRFGDGAQSEEWVRDWLSRCHEDYEKRGFGLWAVVERKSGLTIGYCGLTWFADVGGQPETEIGYRLAKPYWGRGYATEAAAAVRDYGFNTVRLARLISIIDPRNVASIRVAEKIGMHYEKDVMMEGYSHPDLLYVIARPLARIAPAEARARTSELNHSNRPRLTGACSAGRASSQSEPGCFWDWRPHGTHQKCGRGKRSKRAARLSAIAPASNRKSQI